MDPLIQVFVLFSAFLWQKKQSPSHTTQKKAKQSRQKE